MRACFRCDASPAIGSGHVMRCLTLADALRRMQWECIFFTSYETPKTVPALSQSGYAVIHDAADAGQVDALIFDHYGLAKADETPCRTWAKKLLVIDDLADRSHDCDILLDQTYGRAEEDYRALVPEDSTVLTGAKYALLRPQFSASREESLARRKDGQIQRMLISLGTTNLHNSTGLMLEMLTELNIPSLKVDVVLGSAAISMDSVKASLDKLNSYSHHYARLLVDVQDMASLMTKADLAIGAGGTTSWERCCLGLPALVLELADNQKSTARALHAAGAAINLGAVTNLQPALVQETIRSLAKAPKALTLMQQSAARICDGLGADIVAAYLQPHMPDKYGRPIRLRPMHLQDAEQVFAWQCLPETRRHARNPHPPKWEEHLHWMQKTLSDTSRVLMMILCNEVPAGVVRLDKQDENESFEISILLSPDYYKKGIASVALEMVKTLYPRALLLAHVRQENMASRKLFTSQGFRAFKQEWYNYIPQGYTS